MHPAPVRIGRGVWLGANVTILPKSPSATASRAGSVVTKDVAPNAVVVGSPAHGVRTFRFAGEQRGRRQKFDSARSFLGNEEVNRSFPSFREQRINSELSKQLPVH